LYNLTDALSKSCDYRSNDGYFKVAPETTRALVTVSAKDDAAIKAWEASGKAKKVSCVYEKIYNDKKAGIKNGRIMVKDDYVKYEVSPDNKDWCLKEFTVDTSTPIK
jgi:hypothetical protein